MNKEIVLCLKINEEKWIRKIYEGSVCFNHVGVFIEKAEKNGNNEQGNRFEGVFARLPKSDARVKNFYSLLGDDLEIIDDVTHVILRRKSSRAIPVFCMYGVKIDEILTNDEPQKGSDGVFYVTLQYHVPEKMYKGFLDNAVMEHNPVWGFYASSGHFCNALEKSLNIEGLVFAKQLVAYDLDLTEDFILDINESYSELFHKRKELSYQHEIRYILPCNPTDSYYIFKYDTLSKHSAGIAPGEVRFEMRFIYEPKLTKNI